MSRTLKTLTLRCNVNPGIFSRPRVFALRHLTNGLYERMGIGLFNKNGDAFRAAVLMIRSAYQPLMYRSHSWFTAMCLPKIYQALAGGSFGMWSRCMCASSGLRPPL